VASIFGIGSGRREIRGGSLKVVFVTALFAALSLLQVASASADKEVVNFLGQATAGEAGGRFLNPTGIAVNETGAGGVPEGSFYIADRDNFRVQQIGPAGDFIRAWGWGVKDGDPEFQSCAVAANCRTGLAGSEAGQFAAFGMTGVAVDQSSGNVYVADDASHRIDLFTAKGSFIGAFGWNVKDFSEALQFCTAATGCVEGSAFEQGRGGKFTFGTGSSFGIGGLSVAPDGNLYVANGGYRRIDVFRPVLAGGTVTGVEFVRAFGKDVFEGGSEDFEICTDSGTCQGGQPTAEAGGFAERSPVDVEVDDEGNVYALDSDNHRIQKFDSSGTLLDAAFGEAAVSAAFDGGALQNLGVDRSTTPNRLLVSGARESAGDRLAVLELNGVGAAVALDGEDLPIRTSRGLAAARTALGGNVYVTTNDPVPGGGQKVFILNEVPTIDPVTLIGGTTATFSGTVVSNEIPTTYHFEYSTNGVQWTSAPVPDADADSAPGAIPVSEDVTGLTGSQLYFVRLVGFRPLGGRVVSDQVSFTTQPAPPRVVGTSASSINQSSATLNGELDAQNQVTSYHFEYGTADCGAGTCTPLPSHDVDSGGLFPVSEALTGLQPMAVYHFRLVASNGSGSTFGPDRTFQTTAIGTTLPDNRRYELVSPGSNGLFLGDLIQEYGAFDRPLVSADGSKAMFFTEGSIPGLTGNGAYEADISVRSADGWRIEGASPSGAMVEAPVPGGSSSDLSTILWAGKFLDGGPLDTRMIRRADGSFDLLGVGSLGQDLVAQGRWITPGATHVIFSTSAGTAVQLEPVAPASATGAVYDRTGGETHVVSLLPGPGGGITPADGENASYLGCSEDGTAIVFEVAGTIYVRLDNSETQEVASGFPTFAGVSEGGSRVFYMSEGNLFAYDTDSGTALPIGSGGETTPVNISADGSRAYFSSPQELAPGSTAGARNLYVWRDGSIVFVATLSEKDFQGFGNSFGFISLGQWTMAVGPLKVAFIGRANSPTRTNPDGSVLLFQSHGVAEFPFDSNGFGQVYRYDDRDGSLVCISCSPLEKPAQGEAELQDINGFTQQNAPTSALSQIYNVTDDGSAAFFQTTDALVREDTDGLQDVYEWRDGHVSLISSGHSAENDYLYAMTPSGSDVLFKTADTLVSSDDDQGAASIYDARVGGGFAETAASSPCAGESCQEVPGLPPVFPAAGSTELHGPGNAKPRKHRKPRCRSAKHKDGKHKRTRCKGRKHKQKAKTGSSRGGA
jgi:hypothetical protein